MSRIELIGSISFQKSAFQLGLPWESIPFISANFAGNKEYVPKV